VATTEPGQLGFEADIRPLFRDKDRNAMLRAFDLWSFDDVVAHADAIGKALSAGSMPCDGAWPEDNVERFQRWIAEGHAA
jgi:hypothetical protein